MAKSAACRMRKAKKRAQRQRRAAHNAGGSIENIDGSPGNIPLKESITETGKEGFSSSTRLVKAQEQSAVASVSVSNLGSRKKDVESQPNDNQFSWMQLNYHNERFPDVSSWVRACAPADLSDFFSKVRQGSGKFDDDRSSESRVENTSERHEEAGCNDNSSDKNITIGINGMLSNGVFYKGSSPDSVSHTHGFHYNGVTYSDDLHQNRSSRKRILSSDGILFQQNSLSDSCSPSTVRISDIKEKEVEAPMPEPIPKVAPLIPSTNRWVPKSRIKKEAAKFAPDGTVLLSEEDVMQKTKSALNKVTLESMGPISETLLNVCKQSLWEEDARTLKLVLQQVLTKAYDEPYWSSVYANLCARIINDISPDIKDKSALKKGIHESGGQLARSILLSGCQSDYSKESTMLRSGGEDLQPAELEMLSDDYYAAKAKQRKGLGLIKLIGNFHKINILGEPVVIHCLKDLLDCTTVSLEGSLAMLVEFIQIVGPLSDTSETLRVSMNKVFHHLDILLKKNQMVSKSKYTLMNLQEQRANNWKPKVKATKPKTIKHIHDEAEAKNQAKRGNPRGKLVYHQKSSSSVNGPKTPERGGSGLGTAVWADKPATSFKK